MMKTTIVVPAYNEAARLEQSVATLRRSFEGNDCIDVVVVDDGSTDSTASVAARALRGWPAAQLVRLPWNQGKGSAIKAGVAVAQGDAIVTMDADLSGDVDDLPAMTAALRHSDIVIGTRMAAGSRVEYESQKRRTMSRIFNMVACSATGVTASDTQCGYKAFRAPVAKLLFHLTETRGFAVDVELLVLADMLGFSVSEQEVGWREVGGSRVHVVRDTVRMLRDINRARRFAVRSRSRYGADALTSYAAGPGAMSGVRARDKGRAVVDLRAVDVVEAGEASAG